MATTNVNIRMDSDLKRQFEVFCSDMGNLCEKGCARVPHTFRDWRRGS